MTFNKSGIRIRYPLTLNHRGLENCEQNTDTQKKISLLMLENYYTNKHPFRVQSNTDS
jgi:hypothetical protein